MKNVVAFRTILYHQNTEFFGDKGVVSTLLIKYKKPLTI